MNFKGLIGNTPMVRVDYKKDGQKRSVYAKLESYNLTGSIKDRMASYVLTKAKERGELQNGQPIVEVTSGNTGIAMAAVGAMLDNPVHIFMPDWVSAERRTILAMYGAHLHLISREKGGFTGAIQIAEQMAKEEGAFLTGQFKNPDNPLAHYLGIGTEIAAALPHIDSFVAGVGTGGTLMGVGRRLKEEKGTKVIALEPETMPMLSKGVIIGSHAIEGIGDEFVPAVIDKKLIDGIIDINDMDSVNMARKLARELGLGVGISSGANFLGAVMCNDALEEQVVATVFADDNKKYVSTALSGDMQTHPNFLSSCIELIDYERIN